MLDIFIITLFVCGSLIMIAITLVIIAALYKAIKEEMKKND
nr:hypothetical protein [Macrococcus goetzii]